MLKLNSVNQFGTINKNVLKIELQYIFIVELFLYLNLLKKKELSNDY
jgi:hypothetical protein